MGCIGEVIAGGVPRAAANDAMVETRLGMEAHTPPRFLHHDLQRRLPYDGALHTTADDAMVETRSRIETCIASSSPPPSQPTTPRRVLELAPYVLSSMSPSDARELPELKNKGRH
uniref:Uncharacterized protein n=1 Tax=Oryza nivara TaxID=4536 RepID=A0A0E0IJ31_ORYNI